MKKILFVLGLLSASLAASAQEAAAPDSVVKVEYKNEEGDTLPSAEGAAYRLETTPVGEKGGTIRSFFMNGKPRTATSYEDLEKHVIHGVSESWFENGQPEMRAEYAHGRAHGTYASYYKSGQLHYQNHYMSGQQEGELVVYLPDGKLKRRESYAAGKRLSGVCYDAQSQQVICTEFEKMPVFPGGQEALLRFIGQNVRYPAKSLRQGHQGRVFVKFVVDTTGLVQQVKLVKGIDDLIDAEALRVVRSMPRFTPGQQDGRPVRVFYTVPLTFAINNAPLFKKKSRPE